MAGLQDQPAASPGDTDHITSDRAGRSLRGARQPVWKIAREAGLSFGPVARIAKAKGLSRLSALDQRIAIVRYEKKQPGEMIRDEPVCRRLTSAPGGCPMTALAFRATIDQPA